MASPRECVLEDCLDFIGRRVVFSDGLMRLQYFQQFEELYDPESTLGQMTYGRLYNLSEITEFLAILTQAARRNDEEPYTLNVSAEKNKVPKTELFKIWRTSDWKCFRENLVKIQTSMLRSDATASIDEILSKEGENKEIDPAREDDPWLNGKFFKIVELCKLHEKLAPFREELETRSSIAYDEDKASKPMSFPKKLFMDYLDMFNKEEKKRTKKVFTSLLLPDDQTKKFQHPATIRRLLDNPSKPLSFVFLLNRINQLLRAWTEKIFETKDATDMDFPVERIATKISADNGQVQALKKLQRARARLKEDVEDPLAATIAVATGAKRNRKRKHVEQIGWDENSESSDGDEDFGGLSSPKVTKKRVKSPMVRGTMLDKKKSATRLSFTPEKESDSEDIEDPKEEGSVLASVKKRPKVASPILSPGGKQRRSQKKMYEGKRMWSDEEKGAVLQGIGRFGLGKWAMIKKEYPTILAFRTSGQIKDCYRTMKKRGELGDLEPKETPKLPAEKEDTGGQEEEKNEDREEENDEEEKKDGEDEGEEGSNEA